MTNGVERTATSTGVMLADPEGLGNALHGAAQALFDPKFWQARGALHDVSGGRGSAWFIGSAADPWVLRHYRRGGLIARVSTDRYLWAGEDRVRAFREWRLLAELCRRGLPVPQPIAAWYERTGPFYRCDLIMRRIPNTVTLSVALKAHELSGNTWRAIGAVIARLHGAGVDHADLNAHNILLNLDRATAPGVAKAATGGAAADAEKSACAGAREEAEVHADGDTNADIEASVSVIDFDRSRLRSAGAWTETNLRRLHRSLTKISGALPARRFTGSAWDCLLVGYQSARPERQPHAAEPPARQRTPG